jgi:ATP-binding protein involved in chromosome partitioning
MVTETQVRDALKVVQDPDLHQDIVSLGFVKKVAVTDGHVGVTIELTTPACPVKEDLKRQASAAISRLPGVRAVDVEMTAVVRGGNRPAPPGGLVPQVKNLIAVGSGKGGVGKSTVAVNLALGLLQCGASTGVLDADVYGPSIPKMLGNEGRPEASAQGRIRPQQAHGLKMMSMGLILDPDKPVVWRGPIVHTAIRQFLGDVDWDALDYLVIDLPPGTGDVALTLAQSVPLTGAVVVCTPQDVALLDARKAVGMFRQLGIPILGLVENMSYYACPSCGHRDDVFGHGGAEAWARERDIPFLGSVPLHTRVRVGGDAGVPALADPGAPQAVREAFEKVAGELARQVSIKNLAAPKPGTLQVTG